MNAKITIRKIVFVAVWLFIGGGLLILLLAAIGKKLMPEMQVACNDAAPFANAYRIDCSRMTEELGVQHRSLEDGYLALMNETRAAIVLEARNESRRCTITTSLANFVR